jgi:hypothetical protein
MSAGGLGGGMPLAVVLAPVVVVSGVGDAVL